MATRLLSSEAPGCWGHVVKVMFLSWTVILNSVHALGPPGELERNNVMAGTPPRPLGPRPGCQIPKGCQVDTGRGHPTSHRFPTMKTSWAGDEPTFPLLSDLSPGFEGPGAGSPISALSYPVGPIAAFSAVGPQSLLQPRDAGICPACTEPAATSPPLHLAHRLVHLALCEWAKGDGWAGTP